MKRQLVALALSGLASAVLATPFWYEGKEPPTNRVPVAVTSQASATAFESRIVFSFETDPFDCSTFPVGFLLFLR